MSITPEVCVCIHSECECLIYRHYHPHNHPVMFLTGWDIFFNWYSGKWSLSGSTRHVGHQLTYCANPG
jgi:hypothetical protein